MASTKTKQAYFYAVGKRKTSIAKIYITPSGTGQTDVNGKDISVYFPGLLSDNALSPLKLTGLLGKFDLKVVVIGGGSSSQSDAVRHGLSRALELYEPTFRTTLKQAGFLTRDPRVVERKKYGRRKARKKAEWSKR